MITPPQKLRDAAVALSIANLTFIRTWNELLTYTKEQSFFFKSLPNLAQYTAAATNVLFLTAIVYLGIRLVRFVSRRRGDRQAILFVPLVVLPILNSISGILFVYFPDYAPQVFLSNANLMGWIVTLTVLLAALAVGLRWPATVLKLGAALIMNFALLFPCELALAGWHATVDNRRALEQGKLAPPVTGPLRAPNVIWILFDELDYRLLFEDRPVGLNLPQFDRLRGQTLSTTQGFSPANYTKLSIPSLLTGLDMKSDSVLAPDILTANVGPALTVKRITGPDTIFASAREMGLNTSVVGWFLPYCRIFATALNTCSWYDMGTRLSVASDSFPRLLLNQAQAPFETATYTPFSQSVLGKHRIFNALAIRRDALALLSRPNPGFVYIHHMATHAPFVFDRQTKALTRRNTGANGYIDALAWADLILGEFRAALEASGAWDRSIVLVTSDHHFRNSAALDGKVDYRVPWLLKLPNQNNAVSYTSPLHTLVTRKLLEAAMRSEITTHQQAAAWLNLHEKEILEAAGKP